MTEQAKRPCPNCGERGTCIEQYARDYGVGSRYHVTCANCGARGPAARSDRDALVAWNRRAVEDKLLALLRRFVDGINDESEPWFFTYGSLTDEERALLEEAEAALAEAERAAQ